MDFDLPLIYRNTNFLSGGAGGSASNLSDATLSTAAPGDISMGLYYQFLRESGAAPDVVGSIRVRAPTGRSPFGIKLVPADPNNNNLNIADQLPTGNGVWAVTAGLSLLKTYDPVVLFVNASYTYNIKRSVSDISSVQGQVTPADVKLGDTFGFGGGLALALNDRTSMSLAFNASISEQHAGHHRRRYADRHRQPFQCGHHDLRLESRDYQRLVGERRDRPRADLRRGELHSDAALPLYVLNRVGRSVPAPKAGRSPLPSCMPLPRRCDC
ncbi:hypothetical protein ACU4GD_07090 [Cupriavidus basilensis]